MYYFGSLRFAFLGLPLVTLENSVLGISYAIVVATNRQGSWDDRNVMARGAVSLAAVLGRSTDAMESGRKTPAIGGEAKTTFMSSSTRVRKNSSAPAVGGATDSSSSRDSEEDPQAPDEPDDDVEEVDEAPAMSWWSMKQEAIRQARSTKNSHWIKRGDWDPRPRGTLWDPELDSSGRLIPWHSGYTPEPSDDEGYAMDLSMDVGSDATISAAGGETKKTLVSPSIRDRKNSSVPAVGGATASRDLYTSSQGYSQAPDDVRLTVEEVDDPVDEAPAMSWWSMKQEAIRQARSTKNSHWIKRGDWDPRPRGTLWDPELDSSGRLIPWHSGYTPETSDDEGDASSASSGCGIV